MWQPQLRLLLLALFLTVVTWPTSICAAKAALQSSATAAQRPVGSSSMRSAYRPADSKAVGGANWRRVQQLSVTRSAAILGRLQSRGRTPAQQALLAALPHKVMTPSAQAEQHAVQGRIQGPRHASSSAMPDATLRQFRGNAALDKVLRQRYWQRLNSSPHAASSTLPTATSKTAVRGQAAVAAGAGAEMGGFPDRISSGECIQTDITASAPADACLTSLNRLFQVCLERGEHGGLVSWKPSLLPACTAECAW